MKFIVGFLMYFCLGLFDSTPALGSGFQDGDLIFHQSQSQQSKAIQEATESPWSHVGILFQDNGRWMVFEAVQPVRVTDLNSFVSRGRNGAYRVYRLPGLSREDQIALRKEAKGFLGKNYDIYFEWSDDLIYCSELVYKLFLKVTGTEIGLIQKFRDLKLDGPHVQLLKRQRLDGTGRALDLEESIVTPVSQLLDHKLYLVKFVE